MNTSVINYWYRIHSIEIFKNSKLYLLIRIFLKIQLMSKTKFFVSGKSTFTKYAGDIVSFNYLQFCIM